MTSKEIEVEFAEMAAELKEELSDMSLEDETREYSLALISLGYNGIIIQTLLEILKKLEGMEGKK